MREILFRGKRLDNGEWVEGYVLMDTAPCSMKAVGKCCCKHDGSNAYIFIWEDELHEYNEYKVDQATVGQYTGLKDKNGKQIFEGDIVEYVDFLNRIVRDKVIFLHGKFLLAEFWWGDGTSLSANDVKVIGNIHDTPYFLEDKV